ncbi:MAG: alanine--tRNA ligase-related protein [candidate division WOR-3 bacterium]
MKIKELRLRFIEFYRSKGYTLYPPSSLISQEFPYTYLASLDMKYITNCLTKAERIVIVQDCFRHFDVQNVGDGIHLSLFEMGTALNKGEKLKEEIIELCHSFLHEVCKIPLNKLFFTVFGGGVIFDKKLSTDCKSIEILNKLGYSSRVIKCRGATNFFGGTSSHNIYAGPRIEIYYDTSQKCASCSGVGHAGCKRFVEIATIPFLSYIKQVNGEHIELLPYGPSINASAIGFERLAMISMQASDIYNIDFFNDCKKLIQIKGKLKNNDKVIAKIIDHVRAACFLIADGAKPSNKGRGNVFRKLIRAIYRNYHTLGFCNSDLLRKLIQKTIIEFSPFYGILDSKEDEIFAILEREKARYGENI